MKHKIQLNHHTLEQTKTQTNVITIPKTKYRIQKVYILRIRTDKKIVNENERVRNKLQHYTLEQQKIPDKCKSQRQTKVIHAVYCVHFKKTYRQKIVCERAYEESSR